MTSANDTSNISISPLDLPTSCFVNNDTPFRLQSFISSYEKLVKKNGSLYESFSTTTTADMPDLRLKLADDFYTSETYKTLRNNHNVNVKHEIIDGVYTEIFIPNDGIALENNRRVLINLHGGGFESGSRTSSHLESIPIAAIGKIKVISIDYRMAPEYRHPAGMEDALTVYNKLLNHYKPENIGLYGCSAGAILASQVISQLLEKTLPLPGMIGMFCASACGWSKGDSGTIAKAMETTPPPLENNFSYFDSVEQNPNKIFPANDINILKKFPPSLLISSSRDYALSSVISCHSKLIKAGVEADLHVWDGLEHSFIHIHDLQESKEAYNVLVSFFNKHLGNS